MLKYKQVLLAKSHSVWDQYQFAQVCWEIQGVKKNETRAKSDRESVKGEVVEFPPRVVPLLHLAATEPTLAADVAAF